MLLQRLSKYTSETRVVCVTVSRGLHFSPATGGVCFKVENGLEMGLLRTYIAKHEVSFQHPVGFFAVIAHVMQPSGLGTVSMGPYRRC